MKHSLKSYLVSLGGSLVLLALTSSLSFAAAPTSAATAPAAPNVAAASPDLTRSEALEIIRTARHYVAHPTLSPNGTPTTPLVTSPDFEVATPPPPPRAETKPTAPGTNYVWVAGHYMPVAKVWRWVRGEWAVPATSISVWIPARYDEQEKNWRPGYWQPDVPSTPTAQVPSSAPESANAK